MPLFKPAIMPSERSQKRMLQKVVPAPQPASEAAEIETVMRFSRTMLREGHRILGEILYKKSPKRSGALDDQVAAVMTLIAGLQRSG